MAQKANKVESSLLPKHSAKDTKDKGTDWSEKIEKAREARLLGQKLREGKPLGMGVYKTYGKGRP